MTKGLIYFLALVSIGFLCPTPTEAQVKNYKVGRTGDTWESQIDVSGGLDLKDESVLRPIGLEGSDNIVQALRWISGTTDDFIAEGDAHVWDNAAIKGDDAILIDGIDTTSTDNRFKTLGADQTGRRFFIDLGAAFPVNRILFYPRPGSDEFPRAYELSISDGRSYTASNQPRYEVLRRVDLQLDPIAETVFPEQLVRFIQLRILSSNPFELAEIEIYGEGFVPKGAYASRRVQLSEPSNLGQLYIKTSKFRRQIDGTLLSAPDGDANVTVRLRNGADETPQIYHEIVNRETGSEQPTTEEAYSGLATDFRGSITDDRANWTRLNPIKIDSSGVTIVPLNLPGPREYFEFDMTFLGTSTDIIQVDSLAITYSAPLSDLVEGTVSLLDNPRSDDVTLTVPAGVDTNFVYDLTATFSQSNQIGFDGILIRTQSEPEFLKLEMGNPLVEWQPDSLSTDNSGLTVYFPSNRVNFANNVPVRVTFRSSILVYATDFEAAALDTRGSLPQPVTPKVDAKGRSFVRVFFTEAGQGKVIENLTVTPRIITPNNDGINDNILIDFKVLRLVKPVGFDFEVYDLGGRVIRRLALGLLSAGEHQTSWDGMDNNSSRVPPGMYVLRMEAAIESGNEGFTRIIGVSY